ncbi:MAG: hypothetical protein EB082_19175, partial [Verrucomicrobia bacterium]|nr:hypothetical protein [Verrucomicrobiota bacterium]NDD40502.1 hypothetical protein [Verrucomicrobiota bacterium]NDF00727.1 hypothetical protein [Verrucomicrobiota bacterium]
MQVTSLLSQQEEHNHANGEKCSSCGHDHEHASQQLGMTLFGLILIINSFIIEQFTANGKTMADLSAGIGAIVLGWPIVVV